MKDIKLSTEEKERMVSKIKDYFDAELGQEIGGFDAEFLIVFFAREIGPHFYNQGLTDAHTLFLEKSEEIGYLMQDMERPPQ